MFGRKKITNKLARQSRNLYSDKLKEFFDKDEVKNNNEFSIDSEKHSEFMIYDINKFLNGPTKIEFNFKFIGHKWNVILDSYDKFTDENTLFSIYIVIDDSQDEPERLLTKILFAFTEYNNPFNNAIFKSSSLNLMCNENSHNPFNCYKYVIYKSEYEKYLKNIIKNNCIILNVYIRSYYMPDNILIPYIRGLKSSIKSENKNKVKYSNIYEFPIDDWKNGIKSYISPFFRIGDYLWKIILYPTNDSARMELELSSTLKDDEKIFCNVVFFIRNSNDFLTVKSDAWSNSITSTKLICFNNEKNTIHYDNFISKIELLEKKNELTNKYFIELNKVVIGVYIRIYENNEEIQLEWNKINEEYKQKLEQKNKEKIENENNDNNNSKKEENVVEEEKEANVEEKANMKEENTNETEKEDNVKEEEVNIKEENTNETEKKIDEDESKQQHYINILKNNLTKDDLDNDNVFNTHAEDYFEIEIDEFEKILNSENSKKTFTFEICGYKWKSTVVSNSDFKEENDYFEFYLQNIDNKDENQHVLTKFILSFKDCEDPTNYKTFNVSSLYCFNNTNSNINRSGYRNKIFKSDYESSIKPLIKNNKIIIGIYIRVYNTTNGIDKYSSKLKELITNDQEYKVKDENYYEFAIDDWKDNENFYISPVFKIGDTQWNIWVYPDEEGYVEFWLLSSLIDQKKCINFNSVFFIRNSNDFSCVVAKPWKKLKCINNEDEKIIFNKFIKKDDLYIKDEKTNRSLVENNKVVYGVYIRIYENDGIPLNIQNESETEEEENLKNIEEKTKDLNLNENNEKENKENELLKTKMEQFKNELKNFIPSNLKNEVLTDDYYEWKIENYSNLEIITYSPEFVMANHKW